ncbi:MAG: rhomboid family intramembrane serine protease [Bacteroidetes bacterium]|nr:rhomboid family intramembrane serine protease [Bacteroidota bacterium]
MTITILIITGIISIFALNRQDVMSRFQFNAYMIRNQKEWWRFFTYAFLHADFIHLAVNLFVLYSFGEIVEMFYKVTFPEKGGYYFFLLYTGGILFSTLPSYWKHKEDIYYNAVGASGAVSAVLFASILFYPEGKISFIFLPIPIPAVVFGVLYLVYSAYMSNKGKDNIGHDAHFWGAIFGISFTILLKPALVPVFFSKIAGMFS